MHAALEKHGIAFLYSLVSDYAHKSIVADIQEYEYTGSLRNTKEALSTLLDLYDSRGVSISPLALTQEEESELYNEVRQKAPKANLVIKGKAGVVDETRIGEVSVVVVTGSIQLWDVDKRVLLFDTLEVEAVAFDPLAEQARKKAFHRFGQISSSLLLSSFF